MNELLPLTLHIKNLQKEIDKLEWEGSFKKADVLRESLKFAQEENLEGCSGMSPSKTVRPMTEEERQAAKEREEKNRD